MANKGLTATKGCSTLQQATVFFGGLQGLQVDDVSQCGNGGYLDAKCTVHVGPRRSKKELPEEIQLAVENYLNKLWRKSTGAVCLWSNRRKMGLCLSGQLCMHVRSAQPIFIQKKMPGHRPNRTLFEEVSLVLDWHDAHNAAVERELRSQKTEKSRPTSNGIGVTTRHTARSPTPTGVATSGEPSDIEHADYMDKVGVSEA